MSKFSTIQKLIEKELEDTDCFLVDSECNSADTVMKFFIDGHSGVKIDFCAKLSRKISKHMDKENTDDLSFRFEISSPGLDKPLKDIRQFPQHLNRTILAEKEKSQVEGKLIQVFENSIVIETFPTKKTNSQNINIELNSNTKIKVIPSFK